MLALTAFVFQGKFAEADPLNVRVLQILAATVGEGHPYYAATLNNRAGLLRAQVRAKVCFWTHLGL